MKKERILFFSPFQVIEKHSFPEAAFARSLPADKFEVSYLGCGGLFESFCIGHTANGLTEKATIEEKRAVCDKCIRNRRQVFPHFSSWQVLDDFYDLKWDKPIDDYIASIRPAEIYESDFEGFKAARIAAFEFILDHKIFDITAITEEQFGFYKLRLKAVLRALVAFLEYAKRFSFDKLFVYIQPYSVNNIVREVARRMGKPVAFAHPGFNLKYLNESIYFSWTTTIDNLQGNIKFFRENERQIALDYSKYPLSLDQFREQTTGSSYFNYSANRQRNLRQIAERFGLEKGYKKVALLAMSSSDESYAADFSFKEFQFSGSAFTIFPDQADWLRANVDYFRRHPEYKLIVRIHPREFPNQREKVLAPKVKVYQEILSDLPENISLDYPEMRNSIYDLFELVDFVLAAQSSIGFDATRIGVPVIACADGLGIYSTRWLCRLPSDKEEFMRTLEEFLRRPVKISSEAAIRALEWNLFLYTKGVLPFRVNGFWRKFEATFTGKVLRKLRGKVGLPTYSFSTFLRMLDLPVLSRELFREFTHTEKEMVALRGHPAPAENDRINDFIFRYFVGLFEIYFQVTIAGYQTYSFRSGDAPETAGEGNCVFYVGSDDYDIQARSEKGGITVALPKKSNVASVLTGFIVEYSQRTGTKISHQNVSSNPAEARA